MNKTTQPASDVSSKVKNNSIYYLIIAAAVFLLYFPILHYSFTNHDDTDLITDSYSFLKKPSDASAVFSRGVFYTSHQEKLNNRYYRPILTLSFFIDTQTGGKHHWQFYFTNILLHLSCCLLLFYLLLLLNYEKNISFIVALVFAVHPALVQAVAWVPGRNDSLLALFTLLSFIFYVQYFQKEKIIHAALHLVFFSLGLLTKESFVLFPFILIAYFMLKVEHKKKFFGKLSELKYFIVGWFILMTFYFFIRKSVLTDFVGLPFAFTVKNFIYDLPGLIQYAGKMLFPFDLNTSPLIRDTTFIWGICTIGLLGFALYKSKHKDKKNVLFGLIWLLLLLLPALIRTSNTYAAILLEHRMYLPIIGFYLIVLEIDFIKKFNVKNKLHLVPVAFIIVAYFILAAKHRNDYRDEYHYCMSAVKHSPHNSLEHNSLGIYYQTHHKMDSAIIQYRTAISLNPYIVGARNNLGHIFLESGDTAMAKKLFLGEIEYNNESDMAYYNLGKIAFDKRNYQKAEQYFEKSLAIEPGVADRESDLAACYAMQKKYEQATQLCIKILEKYPNYKYPRVFLKEIFSVWDNSEKVDHYKAVLKQKGITY